MKYKLIDSVSKKETICDKVTINGFDYYVSDELPKDNEIVLHKNGTIGKLTTALAVALVEGTNEGSYVDECKKIIATNNPNIDIPKVVDIKLLKYKIAEHEYQTGKRERKHTEQEAFINGWRQCLQSQETHSNSDVDMIEFKNWWLQLNIEWFDNTEDGDIYRFNNGKKVTDKELLQLWKEQQPKVVYYE